MNTLTSWLHWILKPRTKVIYTGYKPIEAAFQRPKTSSSFYYSVPDTPEPTPK
jgi:hypothetical protein